MNINKKLRFQMLAQSWLFVVLFICLIVLLGYLATQYRITKDITQANRNILTQGSINVLKQMKEPINVTVYATKDDASGGDNFRKGMLDFVKRYQREKKNVTLKFINPSEEPKLAQEANIKEDGEVVVEYNKRSEHISPPIAEQEMTNLLVRLSRTNKLVISCSAIGGEMCSLRLLYSTTTSPSSLIFASCASFGSSDGLINLSVTFFFSRW